MPENGRIFIELRKNDMFRKSYMFGMFFPNQPHLSEEQITL